VTEQLLYVTKVRAAVEHVRRRRVPKAVRADVGDVRDGRHGPVHHRTRDPRVEAAAARTEQQRGR